MSDSISDTMRAAMKLECDIRSPPTKRNLLVGARVADLSNESQTCATLSLKSAFEDADTASHCPNATDLWSPALSSVLG